MEKKKKPSLFKIRVLAIVITLIFLATGVYIIKALISDDSGKRKRQIQKITLLKPPPPPPPEIKEKPPEPEEEKIKEPEPEETPEEAETDDGPIDDNLGLDADGTGGGDNFGLVGKKGGRDLIGGDYSASYLMRKYAWYMAIIQDELRKRVNQHMEENGGIPKGNLVAYIKITLDENGMITNIVLKHSSGNGKMDTAVKEAILLTQLEEPPPQGLPKVMELKITSRG